MSKKLAKSDVNVQSIEQMVARMKDGLYQAYQELDGKPETQSAILAVWEQVQQLGHANSDLMALLQGNRAALDEVKQQRDEALDELRLTQFDVEELKAYGIAEAQKRLAGAISATCNIPLPDAKRIVAVLVGDKATSEERVANLLVRVFKLFGNRLYTEEKFNQYSDED